MSLNKRCPKCNALTLAIEGHKFFLKAGGVILWRSCQECGYCWREAYDLKLLENAMPWTKPPNSDDDCEEDVDD